MRCYSIRFLLLAGSGGDKNNHHRCWTRGGATGGGTGPAGITLSGPLPQPPLAEALADTLSWVRDFDLGTHTDLPTNRTAP